jgi:hypothetical protein
LWKSDWRLPTRLQSGEMNQLGGYREVGSGALSPRPWLMTIRTSARATHVVRTDAKAPAKPACRFMGTLSRSTQCGFIRQCGKSSRIFGVLSDHLRAEMPPALPVHPHPALRNVRFTPESGQSACIISKRWYQYQLKVPLELKIMRMCRGTVLCSSD